MAKEAEDYDLIDGIPEEIKMVEGILNNKINFEWSL